MGLLRMGFPPATQRWVRLILADTKAGVLYHGYLPPWFDVLSGAAPWCTAGAAAGSPAGQGGTYQL
jgi:hypothetical protein